MQMKLSKVYCKYCYNIDIETVVGTEVWLVTFNHDQEEEAGLMALKW